MDQVKYEKHQIDVRLMEYLGNVLSDQGLQVTGNKFEAILQSARN